MKRILVGLACLSFLACGHTCPDPVKGASQTTGSESSPPVCKLGEATRTCTGAGGLGYGNHIYIEGRGLESLHFKARGANAKAFSPSAGMILDGAGNDCRGPARRVSVKISKCRPKEKGVLKCIVDVIEDDAFGICNGLDRNGRPKGDEAKRDRGVIVVRGFWDQGGTWKDSSDTVTLSCDASGGVEQSLSADGAVTACIQNWRYDPDHHMNELLACVRALRADYCGNGIPHTMSGTDLDLHDNAANPMTAEQCTEGLRAFEASWSPRGAQCIAHARFPASSLDKDCEAAFGPPDANGVRCRTTGEPPLLFTRSRCSTCNNGVGTENDCPADTDPICKTH